MRVGYDVSALLNPLTGVGHYTLNLLEGLIALDPEADFRLLAVTMSQDTSKVPLGPRIVLRHVRVPARYAVTAWEVLGAPGAERLTGPIDVFHGTNFWVPPAKSADSIITIHDMTFWLYPEMCTPHVQRYRWLVPRFLKRAAMVITPSRTVAGQVEQELKFPPDRIVVTPEGVRGAFAGARPDQSVLDRLGIDGPYVLFAGTQEPRKNLDRLITAISLVEDDVKLVIAGPPGWGSVDLQGLARKLKVGERVFFSGYLPDRELGALMAGARAFVFPPIYEGFGLPPLEAMAAGVPVVASRIGALAEVLGEAPIWCDPLDSGSIADAIRRAVTDQPLREQATKLGIAQASLYTWAETARLTEQAYRHAAGD